MRLSALGDVLHALPVLSALRKRLPEARIDWVIEDRAAPLLQGRDDLTEVHVFPRRALSGALGGLPNPRRAGRLAAGLVASLRARAYDVALDLQGNLKSGVLTRLSGAALRFGLDRRAVREGNQVFTHRRALPPARLRHRVERNLAVASALLGEPLAYADPGFPGTEEARRAVGALLARRGLPAAGYAALHPGTSGFGSFKRWPPDRFAAVARGLLADGMRVVIVHGPGEGLLAEAVVAETGRGAIPLETRSLGELAEVIRPAAVFVGADSGPLHLAGLLGTPLLGLYGPKDPAVYGPYGIRADGRPGVLPILTQDDVACRPCTLRRCADPLCMRTLAPKRVLAAVRAACGRS